MLIVRLLLVAIAAAAAAVFAVSFNDIVRYLKMRSM